MSMILEYLPLVQTVGTVFIAVGSVSSALITFFLIRENKKLRKAETQPKVVAFLQFEEHVYGALNIAIKNIGKGPAINVRISVFLDEEERKRKPVLLAAFKDHQLASLLPQGEQIRTVLGGRGLYDIDYLKPFDILVTFESLNGTKFSERNIIDISNFENIGPAIPEGNHEIYKHLKKIALILDKKL